jgi:DNA topoisomerase-1
MFLRAEDITINKRQLRDIIRNPSRSADAADLVYVTDSQEGIRRQRKGKGFVYLYRDRQVTGRRQLERIRRLVIPPAWENVWICRLENGHLQATGLDARKRKQYRYHPLWNTLRNHTKFYRLYAFGTAMPDLRAKLKKDLACNGLPQRKVLAAVLCLMERTCMRVGNGSYEKLYGSYGLTTLKDEHVRISGSQIRFMFRGKKGIFQNVRISHRRLAAIVRQCRDIPGKALFQYIDEEGQYRCIDSGMVNDYLREAAGSDFTAKDFRTWAGTVQALSALREAGRWETTQDMKARLARALDTVARRLGNTRTVCRKYYVHPLIISLYENGRLFSYLHDHPEQQGSGDLSPEERLLLHILEEEAAAITY